MNHIKENAIAGLLGSVQNATPAHRVLYLCAAAIFLPFPVTCLTVLAAVVWAVCHKGIRRGMFSQKGRVFLYAFFAMLLVVPACYGRWISVLAGFGGIVVFLFLLFVRAVITEAAYRNALDIACYSSVVPFAFALVQKFICGPDFRSTAGLLNANYYGTVIEFTVLILVYRLMTNPAGRRPYVALIAMNVAGLFLCDCQSSWLPIIAGTLILLFANGRKKQGVAFAAISLLLVVVGLLVPGILPRLDRMPQTFCTRLNIWTTAWKGFLAHPVFGQGMLTYWFVYPLYDGYATYHAHSLFLDPLLSYGLAGTAAVVGYVSTLVRKLLHNWRARLSLSVMTLIGAAMAAVCIHGVTDTSILWVQTGMLFFLIAGGLDLPDRQGNPIDEKRA